MNTTTIRTNDTRQRIKTYEKAVPTGGRASESSITHREAKASYLLRQGVFTRELFDKYIALSRRFDQIPQRDREFIYALEELMRDVRI